MSLFPPQLLSRKDKSSFDRLAFLMSKEDNYKRLRDFISTQSMVSCIPYLGRKQQQQFGPGRIVNWQLRCYGNHVSPINVSGVISSSSLICTQKQYLFLSFPTKQYSLFVQLHKNTEIVL